METFVQSQFMLILQASIGLEETNRHQNSNKSILTFLDAAKKRSKNESFCIAYRNEA